MPRAGERAARLSEHLERPRPVRWRTGPIILVTHNLRRLAQAPEHLGGLLLLRPADLAEQHDGVGRRVGVKRSR
jgi:hypothetical protein